MSRAARSEHGGRKIEPRCGAVRVGEDLRTDRHHGLAGNAVGHGQSAPGEAFANAGKNFFVRQKRQPEQFGGRFARDVIGGRTEASRGENDIGAVERGGQSLPDGRSIGHADLSGDGDSAGGQFAREVSEVGVGDEAEQKLRARVDHFGLHQGQRWTSR